jgi:hypothetical protein
MQHPPQANKYAGLRRFFHPQQGAFVALRKMDFQPMFMPLVAYVALGKTV